MSEQFIQPYDPRPVIAHVVFSLDYGGLENGLVNLINGLAPERFRHSIIALTQATDFRLRLRRQDVQVYSLDKRPGNDPAAYLRLYRLLRRLRPDVVHTRNFGTLDCTAVAYLAGVPHRIHGEHGWDMHDPDGTRRKFRTVRRLLNPLIERFVVVSRELEQWVTGTVGISASKVLRICNGVDTARFHPGNPVRGQLPSDWGVDSVVVGSVTRLSEIKDPLNLVRAFIAASREPEGAVLRLVLVGDGALKGQAEMMLRQAGLLQNAWLPGARDDVPELLRAMDIFVLGSRREGISNTVLEAMATGLPVVVSATGGNFELVRDAVTGRLVAAGDCTGLSRVLLDYLRQPQQRITHGRAGRAVAEREFSLARMIGEYEALYGGCVAPLEECA